MTTTQILRLIIGRELRQRGRSKAYLISGAFMLVLLGAVIVLPGLLRSDTVDAQIGTLGIGNDSIVEAARTIASENIGADRELLLDVIAYTDRAEAEAALDAGTVELVLVDGTEILRKDSAGFSGSDIQQALQQAAALNQLQDSLAGSGAGVSDVAAVLGAEPLTVETLNGTADAAEEQARSIIAYGGMMLMYFGVLSYGAWTLSGVLEEKSSRVVEVLLATVKPWQLLTGKIVGIGLLGLVQVVLTVVWALVLIRVTGALELPAVPIDSAITLVVWFILGYGLFSVLYATAGALVSRVEDAQPIAAPISFLAIGGFLVSFMVLDSPGSTLAQIVTQVPFAAPFVVPIRLAYGAIAPWEYALSVVISLATMAVLIRIAARVYAGGLLNFGGRLGLRTAYRQADA